MQHDLVSKRTHGFISSDLEQMQYDLVCNKTMVLFQCVAEYDRYPRILNDLEGCHCDLVHK